MNRLYAYGLAIISILCTIFGLKKRGDMHKAKYELRKDIADAAIKANRIKDEQLKDAINAPKNKSELIDRIKRNGL